MTYLAIILSYLIGSIPTGLWLGLKFRGIDIRQYGSKNIGATNTMRVLGKKLGAIALAGDAAKGLIAVLLFGRLAPWQYLPLACGIAAILGHTASVFLRFRGGKGVATGGAVFAALAPIPTAIAVAAFAAVLALTRMVSAGSIVAAIVLAASVIGFGAPWPLQAAAAAIALFVIYKHRANIARILRNQENKI
ncbi:MAG: glycerol-3-phosphate 1-O-acyltransferase PlsY [Candidatus Hydrogenedentes bacterium]|nr:glycerol-3-phosphate 1-O-acyltransferase PlsY [Candidatus Hydrogenedentota bacterium]